MDEIKQTAGVLDRQLSDVLATDPLSALTAVTSIRNLIAERERQAVTAAVADHTWREIGVALGVSKQAAFQRFGKDWVVATKRQMSKPEWKQTVKRKLVG